MAIIKLQYKEPKILFGVILPNILSSFMLKLKMDDFESIIKEELNIDEDRLIHFTPAVNANAEEVTILVIYDNLLKGKELLKTKSKIEIDNFNFHIYNFDFAKKNDVEQLIKIFKMNREV